jgi:hypothetical protein
LLHGLFSQVKGNLGFLGLTVDLSTDLLGPTLTRRDVETALDGTRDMAQILDGCSASCMPITCFSRLVVSAVADGPGTFGSFVQAICGIWT